MRFVYTALLFLVLLASAQQAAAQNYKIAAGLRLSSNPAVVNNSVSLKYFFNKIVALEALASVQPAAIGLLAEVHQPIGTVPGFRYFFGAGGFIGLSHGITLGAQGVLGLDYKITTLPLNFSLDWKPELNFTNEFRFEPAVVGATVRFTLK